MDPQNQKYASRSQALIKKMIPQLLISVSLFSFVVSYSSLYNSNSNSSAPKIHHYLSSAKSFHLLSKNCLFLICNGLLVFLSKTSGLIQPPTARDLSVAGDALHAPPLHRFHDESESDESADVAGGGGGKSAEQVSIFIAESEEEEEEQGREAAPHSEDVEKNDENQPDSAGCWLFDDDDGDRLYGHHDDEGEDEDGDEEGAEEKEEMSTEELNKKFEDFIRKMKDEIIINEARNKVLMLN